MANKNSIPNLEVYLEKGSITIFNIYASISCLGYLIDIINFYFTSNKIFYNNLTTISITLVAYSLFRFKKLTLKTSFGIVLYAALANVIIDTFTDPFSATRIYFFLRDSLFIIFLVTLISLIVRKIHAIIIAVIYLGTAVALTLLTKNNFLQESLYLIILFVSAYTVVVYYFVGVIEKSILEHEKNTLIIKEKNEIVSETNTLLEERQEQIEEQAEQLALKNAELEQLNKTKDKFLSVLAHDLKGPFHLITNFAEVLEKDYNELNDSRKIHFIKLLSSTSRKTNNLLETLLVWVRSQSNTIAFKPVRVVVNGLLKENLLLFMENYRNKKIEIIENVHTDCFADADENMLHAVIRNLLSNAIKFTPEGGQIYVSCNESINDILVEIKDTGIGMEAETLENLFKIDKRQVTTGTSGEEGTGLGLLICKDFIEKNGGKILVTSEINKGTVFSFSIPVAK